MKIAGIVGKGRSKGEVIELTAEKKVPLAVKDAIASHFSGFRSYVTDHKLEAVTSEMVSRELLKKKWQNNTYKAKGKITFYKRHEEKDKTYAPQTKEYKITFQDSLDSLGQPELNIKEFQVL